MALKHVETELELYENGQLRTKPMGKRTANGCAFRRLRCTLTGEWDDRHPVQVSYQGLHRYILLDSGRPDLVKFLA